MYLLISILHDESSRIPMTAKLVKQKKMYRYQRKHAIKKQIDLDDLWMIYENKSIITSEFMLLCCFVFIITSMYILYIIYLVSGIYITAQQWYI